MDRVNGGGNHFFNHYGIALACSRIIAVIRISRGWSFTFNSIPFDDLTRYEPGDFSCRLCHLPPKLAQIFPGAKVSSISRSFHSLSFAPIYADVVFHYNLNLGTTFFCFFNLILVSLTWQCLFFLSLFLSLSNFVFYPQLHAVWRHLNQFRISVFTLCGLWPF